MNREERIQRINELYHKSKAEGLTPEEKEENERLRTEYIQNIRSNLRAQLNHIDIVNEDGTVENLGDKYGGRGKH